ncbi:Predicted ATPase [Microbacterium sp. cf046]|nr:Predicted ATPase [Microbacterium sp. cf046]
MFVSSTLRELAPERRAVRAAIEGMRMAPVMFELGARPHPPRELYRAYLEQSDVFVGVYGDSYGWVAPGEDVSGLEDEYNLARDGMPKLIYLKDSGAREPKLTDLIDRIKADDTVSYVSFSTPGQLAERVAADLAALLAERFDGAGGDGGAAAAPPRRVPAAYTEAIGRQTEVTALLEQLDRPDMRLVTLVGPGGIGKSRLAIEVAQRVADAGDMSVSFVLLEHVTDPARVVPAIAAELGVRDSGAGDPAADLGRVAGDRRMLIVLDNFEQVLDAGPEIAALFTELPGATFLVTSRARLRLRSETVFEVQPLGLPDASRARGAETALDSPAVRLFRDRARAANPLFDVTDENIDAVVRICEALEGVPLAIELAAARIRVLSPAMMLERLDGQLALLVASARDLPDRQRTIEATIEWSVGLLGTEPCELLVRLGVFAGDFSVEAVEAIAADAGWQTDTLTLLTELIDNSLVRSRDVASFPLFGMLATVREFALAELDSRPEADRIRRVHAACYTRLALETAPLLQGPTQLAALERLGAERENLRAAGRYLLETGEIETLSRVVWDLFLYWWIRGLMPEARGWMDAILATGVEVSDRTRAIALGFSAWVSLWQKRGGLGPAPFEESVRLFRVVGDAGSEALALCSLALAYLGEIPPDLDGAEESGRASLAIVEGAAPTIESMAKVTIGRVMVVRGDLATAAQLFDEALRQADAEGDMFAATLALTNRGWAALALGEPRPELFERNLRLAVTLDNVDGVAYAFEGLIAIAVLQGDPERAGVLTGAAEAVRQLTGVGEQASIVTYEPFVDSVLASQAAPVFEAGRARGRAMTVWEVAEFALAPFDRPKDDEPVHSAR